MTDLSSIKTLGVVACAGVYPRLVIEGARRAGVRIVTAGARGAVNRAEIEPLSDVYGEFRVGEMAAPREFFRRHGASRIILAGQIKPSCIYTMRPDADARRLLKTLDRRNAHSLFSTVCDYLGEAGIEVLPGTTFMEACMPSAGLIAGPALTPEQEADARFGLGVARRIARLDIGQSVVVDSGRVLAVESFKGTNECIEAGGHRAGGVTLCKVTKEGHDMRFDVPCLGLGTFRHCLNAGVKRVVFEADRTILFEQETIIRLCNEHGISLCAMPAPAAADEAELQQKLGNDAEHAAGIAQALAQMGIGSCAVVCDGVVLAVDDADGAEKCIRRAAAYMARLRMARLIGWLGSLFFGHPLPPPKRMTLCSTRPLSPAARKAAARARMQVTAPEA